MKNCIVIFFVLTSLLEGYSQADKTQTKQEKKTAFTEMNAKARILIRDGKPDEAEKLLSGSVTDGSATSSEEQAMLNTTLGALHLTRGRNDLALEHLQKALSIWEQSGKTQTLEAAETQSYLGNLFRATGKYNQAEEQLSFALLTRRALLPGNDELVAAALNDLGLVYTFSDVDKALDHYEMALKIYEEMHGETDAKIAIAKTNIGYLYSQQELYGDAINYFESAQSIWEKIYSGPHPAKAFVQFSLGQTYERMKDLAAARGYYEKSLALYQQVYPGKHPETARVHNALGNLERGENRFDRALMQYQRALTGNHPAFTSSNVEENPSVSSYYDGNVLLYSLMYKAQALELRYLRQSLRFKDLFLAIRSLESCDSLIDRLRHQISNESDKITLGAIANEVYADGVRISMLAAQSAWQKKPFYEKAFFFSEKSKAAVLLGAISDAHAKNFSGIPASLLEEEKQLKSAITLCSQKLSQKPSPGEEQYLRRTFYELSRTYESFGKKLENEFPAYFNLKYNSASPSIAELQRKLPPATMIISYFIDEKNSALYTFTLTGESYRVTERTLPKDFDRDITGLRNSLFFSEAGIFREAAARLSALLIPGRIPGGVHDLVVIPTARLSTIPFETLFYKTPEATSDYRHLPFLVREYNVRYEFSSSLILQKGQTATTANPAILLCAPVFFASAQIPDLPGTEREVNDISGIFKSRKLDSRLLVGADAFKRNIQEAGLKQYAYLHFATHGVVDESQPDLSRILLKNDPGSTDGFLYAGEIYNLELNAELVTLSACETGLGKISKGEGVIGLSRALVYAGARNCMVSFWKVSDQSTALLMKSYYAKLLDSPKRNLSATLREAKLEMLNHEKYNAPFYWAPFILIGF